MKEDMEFLDYLDYINLLIETPHERLLIERIRDEFFQIKNYHLYKRVVAE